MVEIESRSGNHLKGSAQHHVQVLDIYITASLAGLPVNVNRFFTAASNSEASRAPFTFSFDANEKRGVKVDTSTM